jgi:hypothetical protein
MDNSCEVCLERISRIVTLRFPPTLPFEPHIVGHHRAPQTYAFFDKPLVLQIPKRSGAGGYRLVRI